MLKNFFPNKILSLSNTIINSLILLLIIVVIIGLIYSLLISPPDYIQGDSVRIMYVHVPSSFMALGCFGFIGLASICNLIFKWDQSIKTELLSSFFKSARSPRALLPLTRLVLVLVVGTCSSGSLVIRFRDLEDLRDLINRLNILINL